MLRPTIVPNGEKLRQLRAKQNLTQLELARKANCSKRTIERFENSKPGSERNLFLIAGALNVDPETLKQLQSRVSGQPCDRKTGDESNAVANFTQIYHSLEIPTSVVGEMLREVIRMLRSTWYDRNQVEKATLWQICLKPYSNDKPGMHGVAPEEAERILTLLGSSVGAVLGERWVETKAIIQEWIATGPGVNTAFSIPIPILSSVVHGDLNPNNILFEMTERRPYLIDFWATRRGHALQDIANLEAEIKFVVVDGNRIENTLITDITADRINAWISAHRFFGLREWQLTREENRSLNSPDIDRHLHLVSVLRTEAWMLFADNFGSDSFEHFKVAYGAALLESSMRIAARPSLSTLRRVLALDSAADTIAFAVSCFPSKSFVAATSVKQRGHGEKARIIMDRVYGEIHLKSWEWDLMELPHIQRLRHCKMHPTIDYVYPAATQSCFEHTLGCLAVVDQVLGRIAVNAPARLQIQNSIGCSFEEVTNFARLAAWIHDVGHYPFNRVEPESPYIASVAHFADQSSATWRLRLLRCPELSAMVASVLVKCAPRFALADLISLFDCSIPELTWLSRLLVGTVSAGLLDYLARESALTGVPVSMDIARFINSLTITKENENNVNITFSETQIANARLCFVLLTERTALHKTTRAFDCHWNRFCSSVQREPNSVKEFLGITTESLRSRIADASGSDRDAEALHFRRIGFRTNWMSRSHLTSGAYQSLRHCIIQTVKEGKEAVVIDCTPRFGGQKPADYNATTAISCKSPIRVFSDFGGLESKLVDVERAVSTLQTTNELKGTIAA